MLILTEKGRYFVGGLGVDSGTIFVGDPCYITSNRALCHERTNDCKENCEMCANQQKIYQESRPHQVKSDFISQHVEHHRDKNVIGMLSHICTHDTKSKDKYNQYIFFGKRGASMIGENKPIPFHYFILGCTSVKANAINKTGKFNVKLLTYGIDLEYFFQFSW